MKELVIDIGKSILLKYSDEEILLSAVELLIKAQAGFYNSFTEERFLKAIKMVRQDRTPNKLGRKFLCEMIVSSNGDKSKLAVISDTYRK